MRRLASRLQAIWASPAGSLALLQRDTRSSLDWEFPGDGENSSAPHGLRGPLGSCGTCGNPLELSPGSWEQLTHSLRALHRQRRPACQALGCSTGHGCLAPQPPGPAALGCLLLTGACVSPLVLTSWWPAVSGVRQQCAGGEATVSEHIP